MRNIVLVAALLLHAALLLAWRPKMAAKPPHAGRETSVYLLAPPPRPAPLQRPVPSNRPPGRAARTASIAPISAPASDPAPPLAAAVTREPPPDAVANAEEQRGAILLESARKLAGTIDQQLRKEKDARALIAKPEVDLTERFREVYNDYSDVPNHVATAGGDRIDRVDGPHGSYCVRTTGNGPGGGRDPFKDAGKQMVVNCPERGPLSDSFARRKKRGVP